MSNNQFDVAGLRSLIEKHWHYHDISKQLNWATELWADGVTKIEVSPIFQEVYGGAEDGQKSWPAFELNLSDLSKEPRIKVEQIVVMSRCPKCTPTPFVGVRGKYRGRTFALFIYMEPIPDSQPKEFFDAITNEVRPIQENDHEPID